MDRALHPSTTSPTDACAHATCTAEIHMKYKLRMTPDQVIQNAVNAVKHLRSMGCQDIEFSPEDAGARLGGMPTSGPAPHLCLCPPAPLPAMF